MIADVVGLGSADSGVAKAMRTRVQRLARPRDLHEAVNCGVGLWCSALCLTCVSESRGDFAFVGEIVTKAEFSSVSGRSVAAIPESGLDFCSINAVC